MVTKLMRTQVLKMGGENHCIFTTQQTFHMTCCIIRITRLSFNENLNISGLLITFVCVCAVVVIIIAISPSLNSKIDLKKRQWPFQSMKKKTTPATKKHPLRCIVECLFVYSLKAELHTHTRESSRNKVQHNHGLKAQLFEASSSPAAR